MPFEIRAIGHDLPNLIVNDSFSATYAPPMEKTMDFLTTTTIAILVFILIKQLYDVFFPGNDLSNPNKVDQFPTTKDV